jgi:hypothetical protein
MRTIVSRTTPTTQAQTTTRVFPNGTVARLINGTWRLFGSLAEAEWHTTHDEARRQQAEREGSLAALVCNPTWRLAREL